jgi:Protein of unknown function (DUF3048) N-terminal domain/Protein of unknown function (DUF3048) C-terminal domain
VSITKRGKITIGVLVGFLLLGGVGAMALTGNAPAPLQRLVDTFVEPRPDPCPLTGVELARGREAPSRPVVAVKIGNTEAAYPLSGLHDADVIYEELVEGGLTRFVVLFQCHAPTRVGPVRSARTTDPRILTQYGDPPIMAYSGAAPSVTEYVDDAGVVSLTETSANAAYTRDDSRVAPHNLYVSIRSLYREAAKAAGKVSAPDPVFVFAEELEGASKRARSASVTFSYANTAGWRWSGGRWVRQFAGAPFALDDGEALAMDNVLIQEVVVKPGIGASPDVTLTGSGRVWLLRDGRVVTGRWTRRSLDDVTEFRTRRGDELTLKPGTVFVELVPKDSGEVAIGR